MKTVNIDDVLRILHKYGEFVFVTDTKKYTDMVDEIANIKPTIEIEQIRAEIGQMDFDFGDFYDHTDTIIEMVLEVIDKYTK